MGIFKAREEITKLAREALDYDYFQVYIGADGVTIVPCGHPEAMLRFGGPEAIRNAIDSLRAEILLRRAGVHVSL